MKPNQLAALLNIAPSTLRLWAGKEYAEFLSPTGAGVNGARRSFNDRDARILAWIAQLKAQNTSASDIHATLKSSQASSWRDLPTLPGGMAGDEPVAMVPREAVEERVRALQERYETQLQVVIQERDELKAQIGAIRQELESSRRETDLVRREAEVARREIDAAKLQASEAARIAQQENTEAMKALQERLAEINAKEAELRGRLEQYSIGGRRFSAATLIIIALVIGALLMLVALFLAFQLAGHR